METGRQKLEDEKNFYDSVDQNKRRSCSCQSVAIFFVILIIISTTALYFVSVKMRTLDIGNFSWSKLSFSSIKMDTTGHLTIYQTDLQSKVNGVMGKMIPLENKRVFIKPDGLYLEGNIGKNKLEFVGEPTIVNQKIVLKNVRLKSQTDKNNIVPEVIYTSLGKVMAEVINKNISYGISEIEMKNGEMTIAVF